MTPLRVTLPLGQYTVEAYLAGERSTKTVTLGSARPVEVEFEVSDMSRPGAQSGISTSPITTQSQSRVSGLGTQPSLAGLSPEMQRLVNSSCSSEARFRDSSVNIRAAYYRCLSTNIKRVGGA